MLRLIRSILPLLLPALVAGQNAVTSIAGGDWLFPADPLPALNAPLSTMTGMAIATNGDLLIADADNAIVLRVDSSGTASIIAGNGVSGYSGDGGPAISALLGHPIALAADAQGNIYISDDRPLNIQSEMCNVRKISPDGTISTVVHCDQTEIDSAPQMVLDSVGNLFLIVSNSVYRVLPKGAVQRIAGGGVACGMPTCDPIVDHTPALSAHFNILTSGAFDSIGNLYLGDAFPGILYKLSPAGTITTFATRIGPISLAADGGGSLYAADRFINDIERVDLSTGVVTVVAGNGTSSYSGDGGAAASAGFANLRDLAVGPAGEIYIGDGARVRAFQPGGVIQLVAGNGRYQTEPDGTVAYGAPINSPQGVAVDAAGNVYFGESNGRIRCIIGGRLSTVAGNGGSGINGDGGAAIHAAIGQPQAIAIDSSGVIYFTEYTGVIRKIRADGIIEPLPKPDAVSGYGVYPGIAVDNQGDVFVASPASAEVYRISPGGVVSTYAGTGMEGYNGDNIPALQSKLFYPDGLATDADGNLYIADNGNQRIRKVTPDGVISTVAATSFAPVFVAVDGLGNIFASDYSQVWHLSNGRFAPYSNIANAAISGISADLAGNLYIAHDYSGLPGTSPADSAIFEEFATPPAVTLAPTNLSFQAIANGPAAASQRITLTGLPGLQFSIGSMPSWLTASAPSGTTPDTISLSADPGSLAPGTYTAVVPIGAAGATASTAQLTVTFTVSALPTTLVVANHGLSFITSQDNFPIEQQLILTNTGSLAIRCAASAPGALFSVLGALNLGPGRSGAVPVSLNPANFNPGVYTGTIKVECTDSSQNQEVPVTITILASPQTFVLSQSAIAFTAVAGVAQVPAEPFWVINSNYNYGGSSAPWTASISSASSKWLSISPGVGTASTSADGASPVTVSASTANLAPGVYQGQILVSGGGHTASVAVVLTVLPNGSTPPPRVRPATLFLSPTAGTSSSLQQITVSNPGAQAITYISGLNPASSGITVFPASASIPPGQSQTIAVETNAQGLTAGVTPALTLMFDNGAVDTVNILQPALSSCTPATTVTGAFTTVPDSSTVTKGLPVRLGAIIADSCETLVGTDASGVQVRFNDGEPPLQLNNVGGGYWEASWVPSGTLSAVTLQLTPNAAAPIAQLNLINVAGAATPIPTIYHGGVASAADPLPFEPLAQGGLIAIYGAGFANAGQRSGVTPLPTNLGGVQVMLGNESLPLLYVSSGQIDAVVPYDAPVGIPTPLVVINGSGQSLPETVVIAVAQPAAFLLPQFAPAQAAAVGPDGLATAQTPVTAGDQLVIYAEGLGPVMPAFTAGALAPSDALYQTVFPVSVSIGGQAATAEFAGLAPGSVGEYQINVTVPTGITPGASVPLVITFAHAITSAVATIAVK